MKRLEDRAKMTGSEVDKAAANSMRTNLMSYKRMTRQLMIVMGLSKSKEFRRRVREAIERKDVEETHRLWVKYCDGE